MNVNKRVKGKQMKNKCNNQYRKMTIKSLINSLEEIMSRNPNITLDSEIIISDINMSYFKQEIKVYPTHDYKDGQMKVGLYINPYEKDETLDVEETIEEVKEVNPQDIQAIKQIAEDLSQINQPQPQEVQPIQAESDSLSWLNKYTRA